MIRLLSPPGLVTGLVVTLSVAGGVAFGSGAMLSALLLHARKQAARA